VDGAVDILCCDCVLLACIWAIEWTKSSSEVARVSYRLKASSDSLATESESSSSTVVTRLATGPCSPGGFTEGANATDGVGAGVSATNGVSNSSIALRPAPPRSGSLVGRFDARGRGLVLGTGFSTGLLGDIVEVRFRAISLTETMDT
jgi:hypothetical protein